MAMKAKQPTTKRPTEAMHALRSGIESELSELRAQITEAQDRLESIEIAPAPRAEYLERIGRWVDHQAAQFKPEYAVSPLRDVRPRFDEVELGLLPVRGSNTGESIASADAGPLLCWLLGNEIKRRLGEVIESADLETGPPVAERPALRRKLEAELRELELREEALVVDAEAAGFVIPRRPDADPEIILSLTLEDSAA
jgi:hypothetical protein